MERELEEDDVKVAIVDCGGDMAPRPDGFKFSFIQVAWDVLKTDFYAMKSEFHRIGRLNKKINATSLTVIPKVTNPMDIMESRPINLVGCMYNLLSKILSSRLKKVILLIISPFQGALEQK